jgi:hypothetical protein
LVSIYETPGMKLLDRRSLAADGIQEFQWFESQRFGLLGKLWQQPFGFVQS